VVLKVLILVLLHPSPKQIRVYRKIILDKMNTTSDMRSYFCICRDKLISEKDHTLLYMFIKS
jgi:hypothetical protein